MYQNDFEFRRLFKAYPRLLEFTGRSTRTELLGYWVTTWLVGAILNWGIVMTETPPEQADMLVAIARALLLLPAPALAVRRAHDCGWPGAVALVLIIPAIALMVFSRQLAAYPLITLAVTALYIGGLVLLFWTPQEGDNRFGPDPRLAVDGRYELTD
ncbi:DUF805 domain-containing protein [Sphingomonas sp. ASV193]|uniref:DUF805 domain-containing protein n=1 Tax=Sphingomonas sp. ASV193 TaxID=3144405 RepID=UPI0032E89EB7